MYTNRRSSHSSIMSTELDVLGPNTSPHLVAVRMTRPFSRLLKSSVLRLLSRAFVYSIIRCCRMHNWIENGGCELKWSDQVDTPY
jgi:hypothetical protein